MNELQSSTSQLRSEQSYGVAHEACTKNPWSAEAHLDEAIALEQGGRLGEAVAAYFIASSLMQAPASCSERLQAALHASSIAHGGITDASVHFVSKLLDTPGDADALVALARLELHGRCRARAIVCFERALGISPSSDVRRELVQTLWDLGHSDRAKQELVKGLESDPADLKLLRQLVHFAQAEQDWPALESYSRRLVELSRQDGMSWVHLGTAVQQLKRPIEAAEILDRAIEVNPNLLEAYVSLSAALADQGDFERASRVCQRGLALEPHCAALVSRMLFLTHFAPEASAESILAEHRALARHLVHPNDVVRRHCRQTEDPDRPLRVGYVFSQSDPHPLGYHLEPILKAHDPSVIQSIVYSDVVRPNATTNRLRDLACQFTSVAGLSDGQLASRIAADEVDILVDLAGHTDSNRLAVFARKPCPIQVSWLGYFDTTGLDGIDYYLADEHIVPLENERFFVEKVQRLTPSAICYLAPEWPSLGPPPCLTRGCVSFGCFEASARIAPNVIRVFAQILREVSSSRLVLTCRTFQDGELRQHYLTAFAQEGVDAARLDILPGLAPGEDHSAFSKVDIALASFPYGEETVVLHALWMGVPVVGFEGKGLGQRGVSRVLRLSDHAAWIADTSAQYISIAKQLASDQAELARLRSVMRSTLEASPLMDHVGVTRQLEAAYRRMWREWCEQYLAPS